MSYPLFIDKGGGVTQAKECLKALENLGYKISSFDWFSEEIDFEILFIFGFTHFNTEVLKYLKEKKVKILIEPIFVRTTRYFYNMIAKYLIYLPFSNVIRIRYEILSLSNAIFPNSEIEKREINHLYDIPLDKMSIVYLGLPSYVKELEDKVFEDLFYNTYGIIDFVFYPSARISIRKNQIRLIKALKGTGIKIVLTGCNDIDEEIENEFKEPEKGDKNILCLPVLDKEMLISAYKNARVLAFVFNSETAGIIGIEVGYLGKLVLSDIQIFREYFGKYGLYVNKKDPTDIRKKIFKAMDKDKINEIRDYILENLTWEKHAKIIYQRIKTL